MRVQASEIRQESGVRMERQTTLSLALLAEILPTLPASNGDDVGREFWRNLAESICFGFNKNIVWAWKLTSTHVFCEMKDCV